jgi:hypothetical protein
MMKWLLIGVVAVAAGCSDTPSGMLQRQNDAMGDPFNYSPYKGADDISNGGMTDFNKDAFKRDVNSVFTP